MTRVPLHTGRLAASAAALVAAMAGAPALAQSTADPAKVIARACSGQTGIGQGRLASALLAEAGIDPFDFAGDMPATSPGNFAKALALRIAKVRAGQLAYKDAIALIKSADLLEGALIAAADTPKPALSFLDGRGVERGRLFAEADIDRQLTCGPADPVPTVIDSWEKVKAPFAIALRGKPDQLPLTGDKRQGTDGLELSFQRIRTKLDDGTKKTDTTIKLSGTLGLRLTGPDDVDTAYLYGRYELNKQRTRPTPTLTPPATESDGDTDALETGVTLRTELFGNKSVPKLFLTGTGSAVFDFAKDASRLQANLLFKPSGWFDVGICGFGFYRPSIAGLKAKCNLQGEVLGAAVLRRGALKPGDYDSFLLIGGRASFELFGKVGKEMAVVAGIEYRLLPVVAAGQVKKIERLDASLKYRFWTPDDVGIDVGFAYKKGTNEVSLEKEDILSFGLGVIY